jgi:DNA-binding beta-propeller fold protein YncE
MRLPPTTIDSGTESAHASSPATVVNAGAANVSVFDARTRLRIATVELAEAGMDYNQTMLGRAALPIGVVVDPVRPRAYVAISGGDRIAR